MLLSLSKIISRLPFLDSFAAAAQPKADAAGTSSMRGDSKLKTTPNGSVQINIDENTNQAVSIFLPSTLMSKKRTAQEIKQFTLSYMEDLKHGDETLTDTDQPMIIIRYPGREHGGWYVALVSALLVETVLLCSIFNQFQYGHELLSSHHLMNWAICLTIALPILFESFSKIYGVDEYIRRINEEINLAIKNSSMEATTNFNLLGASIGGSLAVPVSNQLKDQGKNVSEIHIIKSSTNLDHILQGLIAPFSMPEYMERKRGIEIKPGRKIILHYLMMVIFSPLMALSYVVFKSHYLLTQAFYRFRMDAQPESNPLGNSVHVAQRCSPNLGTDEVINPYTQSRTTLGTASIYWLGSTNTTHTDDYHQPLDDGLTSAHTAPANTHQEGKAPSEAYLSKVRNYQRCGIFYAGSSLVMWPLFVNTFHRFLPQGHHLQMLRGDIAQFAILAYLLVVPLALTIDMRCRSGIYQPDAHLAQSINQVYEGSPV